MADDPKPVPMTFEARDVANMAAGALFDLAGYIQRNYIVNPHAILNEMARIASMVQQLPVQQMDADQPEARVN